MKVISTSRAHMWFSRDAVGLTRFPEPGIVYGATLHLRRPPPATDSPFVRVRGLGPFRLFVCDVRK